MKLKADQRRWLEWIREHGTSRGMTLGKGRPHDRRTIHSLIDGFQILPIRDGEDETNMDFAVIGAEDKHGLALMVHAATGVVFGAAWYGIPVRPFSGEDWNREEAGDAWQNGTDTAWECYPDDPDSDDPHYLYRRQWMESAAARSTLAMYD